MKGKDKALLGLVRDYVKMARDIERLGFNRMWRLPFMTKLRDRQLTGKRLQESDLRQRILMRKRGILSEIFSRGSGSVHWEFEDFLVESFNILFDGLRSTSDPSLFYPVYWQAIEDCLNTDAIRPLKPKFMLRPFVDELKDPFYRDILINDAYHHRDPSGTTDYPISVEMRSAYCHLRRALQDFAPSRLAVMTDQLLDVLFLGMPHEKIEAQLERWLFPS